MTRCETTASMSNIIKTCALCKHCEISLGTCEGGIETSGLIECAEEVFIIADENDSPGVIRSWLREYAQDCPHYEEDET
jgi:hypothetical protein